MTESGIVSNLIHSVTTYFGRAIPGCVVAALAWFGVKRIENPRFRLSVKALLIGLAFAPTYGEESTILITPASWELGVILKDMFLGFSGFLKEGGLQFLLIHAVFPIALVSIAAMVCLELSETGSTPSSGK